MTTLIIGPTNAGKTKLLESNTLQQLLDGPPAEDSNTIFGVELSSVSTATAKQKLTGKSYLHYNLLHGIPIDAEFCPKSFHITQDLEAILASKAIDTAIVLVSPLEELLDRAKKRKVTPEGSLGTQKYCNEKWINALTKIDLFAAYYLLLDHLERYGIAYKVIYSSTSFESGFAHSDKVYIHHNLRGRYIETPATSEIERIVAMPGCVYQAVDLPRNRSTGVKGYKHLGGARSRTFDRIFDEKLDGGSLLDIGCANGDFLFRAERLGATKVTGIELDKDRYEAAVETGKLLQSKATIYNNSFVDTHEIEPHDYVTLMNVIHHISDFEKFLAKAAAMAKKALIIEFPLLSDPKFGETLNSDISLKDKILKKAVLPLLNGLPLVGISSADVDQTYVFSSSGMKSIIMKKIGGFTSCYAIESPIKDRAIHIYKRQRNLH
ncbi:MAG: methyltransferase [Gammaproteobacteria bacterium]|nr:methyltransferase [Gammaproteobacteria bacterium]